MTVTVDKVIKKYMALRTEKERVEAAAKAEVAEIKKTLDMLEAWLMKKADEDGVTSFKTDHGTAFLSTTDFAGVEDWNAVLQFVQENDAWDMLQKSVSKVAVRGYLEEHKEVPPGIKYGTKLDINIRKPTAR